MSEFEKIDNQLVEFQDEMARLKEAEKKEGISVHLRDLSPEKLTDEDREIYNKFINNSLSLEEFREYRSGVSKGKDSSRIDFAGYIANKFNLSSLRKSA